MNWRDRANCRNEDPELFFKADDQPWDPQQLADAKAICMACPVRLMCLDHAQAMHEEAGIFGGLTPHERAQERRNRPHRPKRCDICGHHFDDQSPNGTRRTCSQACRAVVIRQQQNTYDQKHRVERRLYKARQKEAVA